MSFDIPFSLTGRKIWVTGHRGMVGSAIMRRLAREDCTLVTACRAQTDLRRQAEVEAFVERQRPDVIIMAAAKVGGILANETWPADFVYDNIAINTHVIEAARRGGVKKLLLLGSSCIYPRNAPQPMREDALLTGALESTNQWYAIAKIAGILTCQAYRAQHGCDFISAMPTNLYGPGDNFNLETGHVIPALMRKIVEARDNGAKSVEIWGTGAPRREFLHVDDMADAAVFLLANYSGDSHINVGAGRDIPIGELARTIADIVGFDGAFTFDTDKPDGTPRKLLDVSRLTALGWTARIGLRDGLRQTYDWFAGRAPGHIRD